MKITEHEKDVFRDILNGTMDVCANSAYTCMEICNKFFVLHETEHSGACPVFNIRIHSKHEKISRAFLEYVLQFPTSKGETVKTNNKNIDQKLSNGERMTRKLNIKKKGGEKR